MIEIYNIAAQPIIAGEVMHITSKQSHYAPHLHIYRLKEDASLPAMLNLSVQINKWTFVIKVATTDNFRNKWKSSRAVETFCGEQR